MPIPYSLPPAPQPSQPPVGTVPAPQPAPGQTPEPDWLAGLPPQMRALMQFLQGFRGGGFGRVGREPVPGGAKWLGLPQTRATRPGGPTFSGGFAPTGSPGGGTGSPVYSSLLNFLGRR